MQNGQNCTIAVKKVRVIGYEALRMVLRMHPTVWLITENKPNPHGPNVTSVFKVVGSKPRSKFMINADSFS